MADIIVRHKKFGNGKYVNIFGQYIEIQFNGEIKKFLFPNAFDNNMLETDDPWLTNKINQALQAVGKQHHSQQVHQQNQESTHPQNSTEVVRLIQGFNSSFIGSRSGYVEFNNDEELFEVIGYLAKPGRLAGIWAEIPNDQREVDFKRLFPGQTYMPITLTTTTGGKPSKFSPQFRINLADITNCPAVLRPVIGAGLGSSVAGRINKSKFVVQLVHFFGFKFGNVQNTANIMHKVSQYGFMDAFTRGYNR